MGYQLCSNCGRKCRRTLSMCPTCHPPITRRTIVTQGDHLGTAGDGAEVYRLSGVYYRVTADRCEHMVPEPVPVVHELGGEG